MRGLKQFKGSFVWCVHWNLLHPQNLWAGKQGFPSAPELSVALSQRGCSSTTWPFFCHVLLLYPTQISCCTLAGGGDGVGGGVTHSAPSSSSWHLTYWCRGSQLEQTQRAVSQLRCLCLWAPGLQSWEQVTMSQRLFNSYTYTGKLGRGGCFQADFIYIFHTVSRWEFSVSRRCRKFLESHSSSSSARSWGKGQRECTKIILKTQHSSWGNTAPQLLGWYMRAIRWSILIKILSLNNKDIVPHLTKCFHKHKGCCWTGILLPNEPHWDLSSSGPSALCPPSHQGG